MLFQKNNFFKKKKKKNWVYWKGISQKTLNH